MSRETTSDETTNCDYCDGEDLVYELSVRGGSKFRCIECLAIEQGQQKFRMPFDRWIDKDTVEPMGVDGEPDFEPFDPREHDYKTVWGHPIPPHDMISLSEDGIRAYTRGPDGRRTKGITVENCTVKHMRGVVALALGSPPVKVTDCRVIECQHAFGLGSKAVVKRCSADARYGKALTLPYSHKSGASVELTILESTDFDKPHPLAQLNGRNHRVTLESAEGAQIPRELPVEIGKGRDAGASGIEIINRTRARVLLAPGASNCRVTSRGPVDDEGEGNTVERQ